MIINDYFYVHGTKVLKDRIAIEGLEGEHTTNFYIRMFKERLDSINLKGRTAVLYAAGPVSHSAELTVSVPDFKDHSVHCGIVDAQPAIKGLAAYMFHRYLKILNKSNDISYINANCNTCASSMYSVLEANQLLQSEYDHVIVIAEEQTRPDTLRLFNEMRIPILLGEGFACVVFSAGLEGSSIITDCKAGYQFDSNPFKTTEEGYKSVYTPSDYCKVHGTGTTVNDIAESFIEDDIINYKKTIGHTQGASTLIELCMVLDDTEIQGTVLNLASGLGGYYGGFVVNKRLS